VVEALNVAVTEAAALIVTEQAPAPVHAPLQPAKVAPLPGVAINVTTVPLAKFAVHVVPQLMPDGLLVTVPLPVPASVTVNGVGIVPVTCIGTGAELLGALLVSPS
jgi:hypothetical protein